MIAAMSVIAMITIGVSHHAATAPGGLDPTFDLDGRATTQLSGNNDVAHGVALQPDGKIVLAGAGGTHSFAAARYLPDGKLDTTFSGDGVVATPIGPVGDIAKGVAVQADEKLVVAGETNNGTDIDFAVVRYLPDGSLDAAFSGDGIQTTGIGPFGDRAEAMALQPDGKILVVGTSFAAEGFNQFALVRYTTAGDLDAAFGGDGIVTTRITAKTGDESHARAVVLQPDGRIVVAGDCFVAGSLDLCLARYESDGDLDPTFSRDGTLSIPIPAIASGVALQPDGKIIVSASQLVGAAEDFLVVRLEDDGVLDETFGGDGTVTTAIGNREDIANGVVVQLDAKIVVGGTSFSDTDADFAVVRYETNGDLDPTFSKNGIQTVDFGPDNDEGLAVALDQDARIVLAGYSANQGFDWDFAVARLFAGPTTTPFTTPGAVRSNVWRLSNGFQGVTDTTFSFASSNARPVVGDWDGDGDDEPGTVRANIWSIADDVPPVSVRTFRFASVNDFPVVGDWDGDGDDEPGVVRGNVWYVSDDTPPNSVTSFAFAKSTDRRIVGDWDGDGDDEPGAVRGNVWFLTDNTPPSSVTTMIAFAKASDMPIPGDWNGDGTDSPGAVRGNTWYLNTVLGTPSLLIVTFGEPGDSFVAGAWEG